MKRVYTNWWPRYDKCLNVKIENFFFISDGHIDDNFERKICVIAGTQTTDLQFSVLAP